MPVKFAQELLGGDVIKTLGLNVSSGHVRSGGDVNLLCFLFYQHDDDLRILHLGFLNAMVFFM